MQNQFKKARIVRLSVLSLALFAFLSACSKPQTAEQVLKKAAASQKVPSVIMGDIDLSMPGSEMSIDMDITMEIRRQENPKREAYSFRIGVLGITADIAMYSESVGDGKSTVYVNAMGQWMQQTMDDEKNKMLTSNMNLILAPADLLGMTDAILEEDEEINGVPTYRVRGMMGGSILEGLAEGIFNSLGAKVTDFQTDEMKAPTLLNINQKDFSLVYVEMDLTETIQAILKNNAADLGARSDIQISTSKVIMRDINYEPAEIVIPEEAKTAPEGDLSNFSL